MKDFFDIISSHPISSIFVGVAALIALNIICQMFVDIFQTFRK